MSYIDEFIKWLEHPHKREWRPKQVHILAVTNKKTGKVCDIAVTHDVPPLKERKWKLQCMYPESEYSYERMQTDIRNITKPMSGTGHRLQNTPCAHCGHAYESINTWVCGKTGKPIFNGNPPCDDLTDKIQELKWKKEETKST